MAIHTAEPHAHSAHHWEWSWAPAAISVGILCLSLTIPMYFVYEAKLAAIIFGGVSVPLILAGIANWMGSQGVTGPTDLKLNSLTLTLFIFSEGLIFFAMFIAYYFLRISAGQEDLPWPPAGTPEIDQLLAVISTAVLVLAAIIYNFAEKKFESSKGSFIILLLLTIVLGAVFMGSVVHEYSHLISEGFKPGTNAYSTPFYTLTGFHAAHILVGILAFVVILFGTVFGTVHSSLVRLAGVYWNFVTLLSFFVVTQVYFW
jgi:cytochrome c oxidase subunit III